MYKWYRFKVNYIVFINSLYYLDFRKIYFWYTFTFKWPEIYQHLVKVTVTVMKNDRSTSVFKKKVSSIQVKYKEMYIYYWNRSIVFVLGQKYKCWLYNFAILAVNFIFIQYLASIYIEVFSQYIHVKGLHVKGFNGNIHLVFFIYFIMIHWKTKGKQNLIGICMLNMNI